MSALTDTTWTTNDAGARSDRIAAPGAARTFQNADLRLSYRAEDVVQMLKKTCAVTGYPKTVRVDQNSGFVPRDLDLWAYASEATA